MPSHPGQLEAVMRGLKKTSLFAGLPGASLAAPGGGGGGGQGPDEDRDGDGRCAGVIERLHAAWACGVGSRG